MFCEEQKLKDHVDMEPFYEMEESIDGSSTSSYLIRVIKKKNFFRKNLKFRR